ncbi:signal peptidase I [Halostella sp. JP-L12]|uniref:signal peptidase I n=1 Tax=Halostella TaxID=1843185 RepID=UPI000EF7842E|nr:MULTISPECIES: signal peptidase I [Halostella]NHN46905.1 signal peptidase I [Halostella sp. JP-L12]
MYRYVGAVVLVGFVALSAATPLGAAYVYSDSMEPTISTGDGFVVVPADDAGPGDVVTFWSDHREEYVTHRVVAETESGYVTKGDNNPITDQAAGHPPVRQSDVEGTVLTLGGGPVTVPHVGDAVRFASKHATVLAGAGALLVAALVGSSSSRSRDVLSARTLFRGLIAASVIVGVVGVLLTGGTVRFPVSDSADGATPETVIFENDSANVTLSMASSPYSYRAIAASGVRIVDRSSAGDGEAKPADGGEATTDGGETTGEKGSANADESGATTGEVTLTLARDGSGADAATVRVYQYPRVLPAGIVRAAHAVHPLVAAVLTVGVGHLPVAALYLLTIDGREPLRSGRWRGPLRGK